MNRSTRKTLVPGVLRWVVHRGNIRGTVWCLYVGAGNGYVTWLYGSHYARHGKRFPWLHGLYLRGFTIYAGRDCYYWPAPNGLRRIRRFVAGITANGNGIPLTSS